MNVRQEVNVKMNRLAQEYMTKKGWSQKRFGKEMKLTEPEISRLVGYRRNWTFGLIERFKVVSGEHFSLWVA
jgi:plasmid maintenance system antidote protein VapI